MEEKDIIDKKLKHEIEIFKVFAFFVFGLGAGISGLLLKDKLTEIKNGKLLLGIGIILFAIFVALISYSFIRIIRYRNKL